MLIHTIAMASLSITLAAGGAAAQCCGGGAKGPGGHNHQGTSQAGHDHAAAANQPAKTKAVNAICPIGKEPINGRTFITYEGDVVGFCCPGCDEAFLAWDKERRDAFIATARSGGQMEAKAPRPAAEPEAPAKAEKSSKDPLAKIYPLANCPVSGKSLGSMGKPVVKDYDGREVRFCCASCVPRFEADQAGYVKKIDEKIIAAQMPYYPLDTCIVAGGKLGSMGEPDNYVYKNRLVRFCCSGCREGFEEDAAAYMAQLDKAAADEQRAAYPLDECLVLGNRLGSMGEPAEVILAGRLVRMCCPPCEKKLRAEPAKFIARLDDAWREAGRPGLETPRPAGGE